MSTPDVYMETAVLIYQEMGAFYSRLAREYAATDPRKVVDQKHAARAYAKARKCMRRYLRMETVK